MTGEKNHCCDEDNVKDAENHTHTPSCYDTGNKTDWLLRICGSVILLTYIAVLLNLPGQINIGAVTLFAQSVFELINTMWVGIVLGIIMIGLLAQIPRELVMSALGTRSGVSGILRATAAGVLLDLCSHGILMVGSKLYERGASLGQVMAFLISSPWNSFSLTLVLITLIGWGWTLAFIILSMLIAVISGLLFDYLVGRKILPANQASRDLPSDFRFWPAVRNELGNASYKPGSLLRLLITGIKDSRMVMRWIFFGVILAALIRAVMPLDLFETYFGPTLVGLTLTVVVATIMEVCSEGSTPIAADLLTRANAPGNSFAFLMTGVSTDYTEVMVLKETTSSWRIALFLPLVTVPQVLTIAYLMNQF